MTTILATETFDSGTTGAAISETGAWNYHIGSGGTAATYQTLAAAHGTEGMRISDLSVSSYVEYDNGTAIPTMVGSMYVNLRSAPGGQVYLMSMLDGTNTKIADLRVNTDLSVTIRNGNTSVASSGPVLTLNAWYRVSWECAAAGTQEARVYSGEDTAALADISGAVTATGCRYVKFGNVAAVTGGGGLDIDTIRVADDFPGPYAPASGGGGSTLATVWATETFESGTNGATISESSPFTFLNGTGSPPTYSTAAAVHGTLGMRIVDLGAQHVLKYDHGSAAASFCVSFYLTIRTMVGTNTFLADIDDNTGTKIADLRLNTDGTVTIRNGTTNTATSSAVLAVGTTYRVAWQVTASGQELQIFTGEGTTPIVDLTGATTGNTARYGKVGVNAAAGTGAYDIDTIRFSDTFPGPYVSPAPAVYQTYYLKADGVTLQAATVGWLAPDASGTAAALSGVYVGGTATSTADSFGTWRGKPVDVLHTFPSRATWAAIEAPSDASALQGTSYAGSKWMASVGMLPNDGTGNLTNAATGAYDTHWANLGSWLVSHGHTDAWIRFGWEFNLKTFLWSINPSSGGDYTTQFVAYWQRIVTAMRGAGFNGKFIWAPSDTTDASRPDPALAYPGDTYVDAVMPDQYDKWYNHPTATAADRWNNLLTGLNAPDGTPRGLTYWLAFAQAHGKTYGFAEWGLWDPNSLSGGVSQGGGGDDPYYIDQVAQHLSDARAAGVSTFELYFNADASDGDHQIHPTGAYPFTSAAAEYQVKFG